MFPSSLAMARASGYASSRKAFIALLTPELAEVRMKIHVDALVTPGIRRVRIVGLELREKAGQPCLSMECEVLDGKNVGMTFRRNLALGDRCAIDMLRSALDPMDDSDFRTMNLDLESFVGRLVRWRRYPLRRYRRRFRAQELDLVLYAKD